MHMLILFGVLMFATVGGFLMKSKFSSVLKFCGCYLAMLLHNINEKFYNNLHLCPSIALSVATEVFWFLVTNMAIH